MRYDVEADWQLLNTCNYRCSYCFLSEQLLGEKLRVHATAERWQSAFDATGLTWLLHITGGEPSAYPGFADLCARLSQRHYLSLNSNLSRTSIRAFADQVDPARVSFINAGLHLDERERRRGLPMFLEHAALLRDRGFPIIVSIVATPEVLTNVDEVIASLRPIGLVPSPKILRNNYLGKDYPRAYTYLQRRRFRRLAAAAQKCYAPLLANRSERPTIDVLSDRDVLSGMPTYQGQLCGAGSRFVRLSPDGTVHRCGHDAALGNILNGTPGLLPKPLPCDTQYCFYFCRKHTALAALPPARPAGVSA